MAPSYINGTLGYISGTSGERFGCSAPHCTEKQDHSFITDHDKGLYSSGKKLDYKNSTDSFTVENSGVEHRTYSRSVNTLEAAHSPSSDLLSSDNIFVGGARSPTPLHGTSVWDSHTAVLKP